MWPEDADAKHKGQGPGPINGEYLVQSVLLPDRLQVLLNRFYLLQQDLPCDYPLVCEVMVVVNEVQGVAQSALCGLQTLQKFGICFFAHLTALKPRATPSTMGNQHGRRDFIWPKTARKLADALGVDPDDLYR
jgi:hypothetical protein